MNEQATITQNKFETFPTTSRVWIYSSPKEFSDTEITKIRRQIDEYTQQWVSHNRTLRAAGDILHGHFIVLMVDESMAGTSGCSIDSSIHFIKTLQKEYNTDLLDRMIFFYEKNNVIYPIPHHGFSSIYAEGMIDDDTIVYDNMVNTKADFDSRWQVRLGDSWHKRMV